MKEIHLLPPKLLRTPSVTLVNDWYVKSFTEILQFEKMDSSSETLANFASTLVHIRNRHIDVVPTMAQGVLELKEGRSVDAQTEHSIQYFLDRFYMSRIGIRMLINQHTMLFGSDYHHEGSKHIGAIDPQCDLVAVVEDAFENARFLCDQYYLASPDLIVTQHNAELVKGEHIHIVYVPSHLYHMLFELFKNSMRAVMEYHSDNYPPIEVAIVKGKEDICIKVSDKGGGIPRSQTDRMFHYMYSTAPQPSKSDVNTVPLAGYGYGLPLSRLYARYFHGDLVLLPCDGYGTDVVIYMKALSNEANELLPIFNKISTRVYQTKVTRGDWSDQAGVTAVSRTSIM
ncbi:hypothetical protein AAG570_000658 [Ranatra chinensis]|uniref:Protein-serine/threonine kinase n=1 Tax=Ranatra chinensis TaxID=642074 RepID=A0ABD0ZEK8_9HEMI